MKKILYVLLAFMCCSVSIMAQTKKGFKLSGELKNLKDGEKVCLLFRGANYNSPDTLASGIAKNNRFEMKGTLKSTDLYYLAAGNRRVQGLLFLDNSTVEIKGSADSMRQVTVKGSAVNDEYVAFNKVLLPFQSQERELNRQLSNAKPNNDKQVMAGIEDQLNEIELSKSKAINDFITAHVTSLTTPYLILHYVSEPDPRVYVPLYNQFSPEVKQSKYGKELKKRLDILATVAVGQHAPNFRAQTPTGEMLSLKDVVVKSKVTVIDFWASWCGPCRAENPNLVKVYEKYHSQGLNIISVSLDKTTGADAWKKAIADDKLSWNHISDLKFWDSDIAKLYGITAIPQLVLVDAEGKIVAKNLRGEALHKKIEELMVN
ncbi:AhpC/TSA family protein [Solitalea sp. MAHUQ-68]|uniref:AhpC/TSA family protein n=1 Tax=Solitalea agri TaxID=2953739 RepID=A0A9X2JD68_9SPHI|nr:TlpA disulfide reductase family protein [Solitalea agri]MCO4294217.1 AhpC/TSA family protein [Solitalea agri]